MLSIKQDYSINDFKRDFQQFEQQAKQELITSLTVTLKQMVDEAREKTKSEGGFGNITWNLRGSIGGIILADHEVVEIYFPPIGKGEVGMTTGIRYATEIAQLQDDGEIILVMVAGMDYAYYVEAREDTDVISGTTKKFEQYFRKAFGK